MRVIGCTEVDEHPTLVDAFRQNRGPILTVANWSGQWPGLVGLLNLNGSLTKAGVIFSSIWSKEFNDAYFLDALSESLATGTVTHDSSHVHPLEVGSLPSPAASLGVQLAANLKRCKAILGIFTKAAWACTAPSSMMNYSTPQAFTKSDSASLAWWRKCEPLPKLRRKLSINGWSRRGSTRDVLSPSLKGISKPGAIVWSQVFVEDGMLQADLGLGTVVRLPAEETERRWRQTTYQWPIMHAIFHGVSRNQFMARHRANHVNVAYAPDAQAAQTALAAKSAMLHELGVKVYLCGETFATPKKSAAGAVPVSA